MKHLLIVFIALVAISLPVLADNSSTDPAAILEKVSVYGDSSHLTARIRMVITSPRGRQTRVLEAYVQRGVDGSETFIKMISPSFLSKMRFLSKKRNGGQEVHWIGTSRGVRRVASGGSNNEHLFDSDFTVEDLSSVGFSRFHLSFQPGRVIEGRNCLSIQAVPKYSGADYARKLIYVDKATMLLMGMDYYGSNGQLLRSYRTTSTQEVSGKELPKTCIMSTPGEDTSTTLTFEQVDTNRAIPQRVFNIGNM